MRSLLDFDNFWCHDADHQVYREENVTALAFRITRNSSRESLLVSHRAKTVTAKRWHRILHWCLLPSMGIERWAPFGCSATLSFFSSSTIHNENGSFKRAKLDRLVVWILIVRSSGIWSSRPAKESMSFGRAAPNSGERQVVMVIYNAKINLCVSKKLMNLNRHFRWWLHGLWVLHKVLLSFVY